VVGRKMRHVILFANAASVSRIVESRSDAQISEYAFSLNFDACSGLFPGTIAGGNCTNRTSSTATLRAMILAAFRCRSGRRQDGIDYIISSPPRQKPCPSFALSLARVLCYEAACQFLLRWPHSYIKAPLLAQHPPSIANSMCQADNNQLYKLH
jgi:hypothetical protein